MKLDQIVQSYGKGASAALLFSLFSPLVSPSQALVKPVAKNYNVLFIVSDDLNNDIGCYGHPWTKTPNIDKLAERGMPSVRSSIRWT